MKKLLVLIGIISLIALVFVPLVSADADITIFSKPLSTGYHSLWSDHPGAGEGKSAVARLFNVDLAENGTYLTGITIPLAKVGSPDVNLTAKLYGATTTSLNTAALNGTLHDTSITTWNSASISTDTYGYNFVFNSTYQLVGGACYYAVIEMEGNGDASNYIKSFTSTGTSSGNTNGYFNYGAWTFSAVWGAVTVYANVDPVYTLSTDPTPTPYPSGSGSSDTTIQELTDIILPWLVPLLICLIPALLGYKFVGELGFFIGLNVGCILAYVTLASTAYAFPLWGIILVGVMDVAVVLMRR